MIMLQKNMILRAGFPVQVLTENWFHAPTAGIIKLVN